MQETLESLVRQVVLVGGAVAARCLTDDEVADVRGALSTLECLAGQPQTGRLTQAAAAIVELAAKGGKLNTAELDQLATAGRVLGSAADVGWERMRAAA